jgi:hypothetical protein
MENQTIIKKSPQLKGLKHTYGRIDKKVLIKGVEAGLPLSQAGRLAGSKAKDVNNSVIKAIKDSPRLKRSIIEVLEKRQRWIINSIKKQDIKSAPLQVKGILFGILTEKLQLLKGDPTQRIETIPKMVFEDTKKKEEEKKGEEIKIEAPPQAVILNP